MVVDSYVTKEEFDKATQSIDERLTSIETQIAELAKTSKRYTHFLGLVLIGGVLGSGATQFLHMVVR